MKLSTYPPRGTWFLSLCGGTAVACLLLASTPSAIAQHISVGIKAGVPLTDVVEAGDAPLGFQAQTKRYTIGPVVDIGLPLGFGVEFGAMYKRFDQKSIAVTTTGFVIISDDESFPIQQRASISAVGHSWEFPVAVQYRFFKSAIRPYVEGGVSFNHLSNVYSFENASFSSPFPRQLPFTIAPGRTSFDRAGGLFGLGVDLKLHVIHVTPGLRYTHYNETRFWLPAANSVDFLVGFTF
jgi:hypothetical protein